MSIEDLVIQELVNDMQQQTMAAPAQSLTGSVPMTTQTANASQLGTAAQPQASYRFGGREVPMSQQQFAERLAAGDPKSDINPETGQKFGQYAEQYEKQRVDALNKRDAAKATILQALRGLDPQIQSSILKRLGLDPGQVKSQLEQQMQLAQYKQQLEQPGQDLQNQIKMLRAQRQMQQGEQELGLKRQQMEAETAGRGETRNIQLMRVLAQMLSANPQLGQKLGPLLMQMLQQQGINLAPQGKPKAGGRGGVVITREAD